MIKIIDTEFAPYTKNSEGLTYKKRKNGVLFLNNKIPLFFLVANPGQSKFFVSCFVDGKGRTNYAFALSSTDEKKLGFDKIKYSERCELAEKIWDSLKS
jgi:hypothetical protein